MDYFLECVFLNYINNCEYLSIIADYIIVLNELFFLFIQDDYDHLSIHKDKCPCYYVTIHSFYCSEWKLFFILF